MIGILSYVSDVHVPKDLRNDQEEPVKVIVSCCLGLDAGDHVSEQAHEVHESRSS